MGDPARNVNWRHQRSEQWGARPVHLSSRCDPYVRRSWCVAVTGKANQHVASEANGHRARRHNAHAIGRPLHQLLVQRRHVHLVWGAWGDGMHESVARPIRCIPFAARVVGEGHLARECKHHDRGRLDALCTPSPQLHAIAAATEHGPEAAVGTLGGAREGLVHGARKGMGDDGGDQIDLQSREQPCAQRLIIGQRAGLLRGTTLSIRAFRRCSNVACSPRPGLQRARRTGGKRAARRVTVGA